MIIAIIKYGMGNVASVQKVLKKLGYSSIITSDASEIKTADLILLPGVGSFKKGIENLERLGLVNLLTTEVIEKKKPFIGICLGMQLVATFGNEPERKKGLGWIDGEVIEMESKKGLRIPHLGWNTVSSTCSKSLYNNFTGEDYYFIHSYHFKPKNYDEVVFTVNYGVDVVAALEKENIHVMQFHPEKSQQAGLNLLKKIINKYA